MQVEIKKPSVVDFNKIEVGELFYHTDEVFMKIKEFEGSDKTVHNAISLNDGKFAFYGSINEGLYNAIRLNDGKFDYFYSKQKVNRINGKLIAEFE